MTTQFVGGTIALQLALANYNSKMSAVSIDRQRGEHMLFKKLRRTMGLYRAQFISMIIMIALGVGTFVGFNMEWYSKSVIIQ